MEFCKNCGAEVNGAFCSGCGTKADYNITPKQKEDLRGSIESLYCLRAGLSMVSIESDKVEEQKDFVKNAITCRDIERRSLKDKLASNKKAIEKLKNRLECDNAKIKDEINKRTKRINDCKAIIDNWENNIKKSYNTRRILSRTFVLMFLLGLPVFIIMSVLSFNPEMPVFLAFPAVVSAISCGIGFWGTIIMFFVDKKIIEKERFEEAKKTLEGLEKEQPKEIKSFQNTYANSTVYQSMVNEIQQCNNEIALLDTKHQIKEKSHNAIENIKLYTEQGGKLYNALVDTYSPVLDPRDWEHVDLIIYILETGRADTFKEALQQLDLFRHTDKIVKAVEDANNAVCSTIRSEINKLGTAFVTCANSIITQLDRITLSQNKISDSLNKSISANALQNALLEKSVISSNELLKSVNVIKDYAENTKKNLTGHQNVT